VTFYILTTRVFHFRGKNPKTRPFRLSHFCFSYCVIIYVVYVYKLLFWSFGGSNRSGLVTNSRLWIGSYRIGSCGTIHFQFQWMWIHSHLAGDSGNGLSWDRMGDGFCALEWDWIWCWFYFISSCSFGLLLASFFLSFGLTCLDLAWLGLLLL